MAAIIDIIIRLVGIIMFIMMFISIGAVNDKVDILLAANSDRIYQETMKELTKGDEDVK